MKFASQNSPLLIFLRKTVDVNRDLEEAAQVKDDKTKMILKQKGIQFIDYAYFVKIEHQTDIIEMS